MSKRATSSNVTASGPVSVKAARRSPSSKAPRRDLGDVAHVDEGNGASPRGDVEAIVLADVVAVGVREVLGEEARAQERRRHAAREQVLFDDVVRHPVLAIGALDGEEGDVLDAGFDRPVDQHVKRPLYVGNGWRSQQEEPARASERARVGRRVVEVEGDRQHVPTQGPPRLRRTPDARDTGHPERAQGRDDRAADVPSRVGDEDGGDGRAHAVGSRTAPVLRDPGPRVLFGDVRRGGRSTCER